jgi:hypothetical protein
VQRHGETEEGEQVGVPDPRTLLYAFSGRTRGDFFLMKDLNTSFEESSFPFPLDLLRLSGRVKADGSVERGASLFAQYSSRGIAGTIPLMTYSTEEDKTGQSNWVAGLFSGGGIYFLDAARTALPMAVGFITGKVWEPWGFYNHERKFVGVGTFRMRELPAWQAEAPGAVKVESFQYDARSREVSAEVTLTGLKRPRRPVVLGILLIDKTSGEALPLNYNMDTLRRKPSEDRRSVTLKIPREIDFQPGSVKAYLMVDLSTAGVIEF